MVRLRVGDDDRPRRAAPPVRRHPVHPQRPRVHPRHLPGARRHHRDLPGLRGARRPDRDVRRRDRAADDAAPADRRGRHRGRASCTSSRRRTTSPGPERMERAIAGIEAELGERLAELERQGKLLEAQRLRMRTTYDIEMMRQVGCCSRHRELLAGTSTAAAQGTAPQHACSTTSPRTSCSSSTSRHVTVPQIGGMYEGDMSRKRTLVDHGFRLPSAMDNRPLRWEEFLDRDRADGLPVRDPGAVRAVARATGVVEQIIRPTGLIDPEVVVKPTKGQIDDLVARDPERAGRDERVLVTTLTKKMSEDLTDYLLELGIRVRYLHSEVDTLRRVELLRELRTGRVRRPRRHQPAARGPRPARGVAGEHPRRRQGGLPALVDVAHPDDRPRRPQRVRPGAHVRRQDHALDGAGDRRDQPPPRQAGRLQPRARASTRSRCARGSPTSPT